MPSECLCAGPWCAQYVLTGIPARRSIVYGTYCSVESGPKYLCISNVYQLALAERRVCTSFFLNLFIKPSSRIHMFMRSPGTIVVYELRVCGLVFITVKSCTRT